MAFFADSSPPSLWRACGQSDPHLQASKLLPELPSFLVPELPSSDFSCPPSQHTASAANTRFCRRGGHRTRHAQGDTGGIESQFRHRFIVLQIKNGVTSLAPSPRTTQTSLYANLPAPGLARQPLVLAVPALRTHRVQQMLLHRFLGFSVHVRESLQR